MRWVKRLGGAVLALVAVIAVGLMVWEPLTASAPAAVPFSPTNIRIARDSFGVPHIYGETDADVAYGVAYAHAEDDFSTLQEVLAMTRGRLGAMTGADGAKVDFAAYWIDGRGSVERHYAALPADVKAVLTGYAAGLNRYAARHPQEVRLTGLFPVRPEDVAAGFAVRSPFFFGLDQVLGALVEGKPLPREGGPTIAAAQQASITNPAHPEPVEGPEPALRQAQGERMTGQGREAPSPTIVLARSPTSARPELVEGPSATGRPTGEQRVETASSTYFAHTLLGNGEGQNGSNAFAIAPRRTTDGATWLVSNSHQPWNGGVAWYELVVHSNQGWDFAGATFPGSPYPFLGHNQDLGWTNTVNRADLTDVYQLTMDASGNRYRLDGQWRALEQRRVWLRVRFGPFVLPIPRMVERSIHGPVIRNQNGVFAVRYAGIDRIDMVTQYYRLQKAHTYEQWSAAMAGQGVPATNFVYADRTGRIGLFYNAMFPDRPAGFDWRGILPGDTSRAVWRDTLPFSRVPQNVDPASGYIMNANNTPFTAAGPGDEIDPASIDPRMGVELDETNRSLRAIELLEATPRIDWAALRRIKYDTGYVRTSYPAALMAQIAALRPGDRNVDQARQILSRWDWNLDGRGEGDALALLILRPANRLHYQRRGEVPDANAMLTEAAMHLLTHFGRLDPPLGEVLRLRHGNPPNRVDLPLDGGNDTIRASTLWDVEADGRLRVRHGDSFLMFVRWDRDGSVHSQSIQPFGQATTQPWSRHYNDQAPLFARHELKPVLFDRRAFLATNPRFYRP